MQTCAACSAPVRHAAKFCTRCGSAVILPINAEVDGDQESVTEPVPVLLPVAVPAPVPDPAPIQIAVPAPVPQPTDPVNEVPSRIPPQRRGARPLDRSTAATWALVTGVAPIALSVIGNVVSSQLGVAALAQVDAGDAQGAWAPVLTVLALVFVGNAALLTVCGIMGARGIRETANGITRGRPLAVAGLAAGGVNLVLWVAGLVVTVSGLNVVLG